MFSYSRSQGLFGGVSLEGTILVDRSDANGKAYQRAASAKQILAGNVDIPAFASGLIGTIERLSLTGAMAHAAKADEIEPGAGRDSWSMDEEDEWGSSSRRKRREDDATSESYFSKAEIDSRQRKAAQRSYTPEGTAKPKSQDPFAASEDEDDPAYSMDRDNATRNAGTYGFSPAAGGSLTNSPSASRGGSDTRQRSGSKSKVSGYFDDLVSSRESRAYSPINGKRPTMGHRKSSSTFSLPKFGKTKTPPPFGSRKTPPVNDALLNRFPEDFSAHAHASGSDDELGPAMRNASPGPASPVRPAFGAPDYDSQPSPRRSPVSSSRPSVTQRQSSSYLNGGLKKMSPAEAVLAAQRSNAPLPAASVRANGKSTDAFGDLWESERSQRASSSKFSDLDDLDRELQSVSAGIGSRDPSKRSTSYGNASGSPSYSSYSRYERPSSSSPKQGFRTGSGGPSKSAQLQRDAWAGFDAPSSEDEGGAWKNNKPPSRTSTATPRGTARVGSSNARAHTPSNGVAQSQQATAAVSSLASIGRVAAAFDFAGQESDDLAFDRGDIISVLRKTESTNDWWLGRNETTGKVGSFPANFTESLGEF